MSNCFNWLLSALCLWWDHNNNINKLYLLSSIQNTRQHVAWHPRRDEETLTKKLILNRQKTNPWDISTHYSCNTFSYMYLYRYIYMSETESFVTDKRNESCSSNSNFSTSTLLVRFYFRAAPMARRPFHKAPDLLSAGAPCCLSRQKMTLLHFFLAAVPTTTTSVWVLTAKRLAPSPRKSCSVTTDQLENMTRYIERWRRGWRSSWGPLEKRWRSNLTKTRSL